MSAFQLSVHSSVASVPLNFEFWRGGAPQLIHEQIQQFTKPGKDGHGERKLGKWSQPFEAELESHWTNYAAAIAALQVYYKVPGSGPVGVLYNNIDWAAAGVKVTVQSVTLLNTTHSRILQIGPNYSYAGAGILLTSWKMTAISTGA